MGKYGNFFIIAIAILAAAPRFLAQGPGTLSTMAVLAAPATPTLTGLNQGPELPPSNLTAQPLPQGPSPEMGSAPIQLDMLGNGAIAGIPVPPNFLGISIELSVATEIFGSEPSELNAPFLNYIGSITARLPPNMGPKIRVGGNSQDTATYNASAVTPVAKSSAHGFNPVNGAPVTPDLQVSSKLFDIMRAIGESLRVEWIYGVNMANKDNDFDRPMVKDLTKALADQLKMLMVGNEPDRYAGTGRRNEGYSIEEYLNEWDTATSSLEAEIPTPRFFVGPSVCCAWTTNQVLVQSEMANRFKDRLAAVSAIKYPQSLCSPNPPGGHAFYLNHSNTIQFAMYDADAVATSVSLGIPYILVETNTASCIGVPWVSNAFSSTLWAIDAALQLAYRNHSGMYLHTSGQSVLYNTFTPPPHKQSTYSAWRTGPIMYALPFMAEALNSTTGNHVRVRDLGMQTPAGSDWGAAYGIYEDEEAQTASRVVLINLASTASDANAMRVQIPVGSQKQILAKFLSAPTAAEQQDITWAERTFGYYSDGILKGKEIVQQLQCNSEGGTDNNTCIVTVPAPGAALVYISDAAQATATVTSLPAFNPHGKADPSIVLNSNGGRGRKGGATSRGSARNSGGTGRAAVAEVWRRALPLCVVSLASTISTLLVLTLQL
ncbi:hypothetical protein CF319_g6421 [Tilletia indica]|nr:hypothetical protein CF319_g6421 [Tilletia indica]